MMKILILEANPHQDLRLNEEIRDLQNEIQESGDREEFDIRIELEVISTELEQLMKQYKPNIVHFCGHGVGEDGLVFRDCKIGADTLSHLFKSCQHYLQCVVLNSCYSEVQANEIVKYIPYVIGINKEIRDDAAIAFSMGFYRALGYGRSFKHAYRCGCKAIELSISDDSLNRDAIAEEIRKLVAINPEKMRKLVPINDISGTSITPEHWKPVFKKKPLIHQEKSKMLEEHYNALIKAIQRNKVVFFLGSDINLCDRPIQENGELEPWNPENPDCQYPPSGKEFAAYLAKTFPHTAKKRYCPLCQQENPQNTERKSEIPENCPLALHENAILICPHSKRGLTVRGEPLQYLSQNAYLTDEGNENKDFYRKLQEVELGSLPNQLHKFFATLTAIMQEKKYYPPYPLIVTTNYDRALEQAFEEANKPFDLVFYSNAINAQEQDRFFHQTPDDETPKPISAPLNKYQGLSFKEQPVILKLYGSIDRIHEGETLVITEENFIEYLVSRNLNELLPSQLIKKLRFNRPDILFVGYPLSDWNQRIVLHRIFGQELTFKKSGLWAIQSNPEPFARKLWKSYDVELYDVALRDYIIELEQRVRDIPAKGDKGHE